MSREYAMSRVEDAIEQSDGNHLKAQRLILKWLEKDTSLFIGLCSPHIQSVVSHAISHVDKNLLEKKAPQPAEEKKLKNEEIGDLGDAILSSLNIGKETGSFGEDRPAGDPKPSKASQSHIDAINSIAKAAKDKK